MKLTIRDAQRLRAEAERTADYSKHIKAALVFQALGMIAAAKRCRDRAGHYA